MQLFAVFLYHTFENQVNSNRLWRKGRGAKYFLKKIIVH